MMNIDAIVFDQEQLDSAIDCGYKNICLCDNSFSLPSADGISYMGIGDVRAVIRLDRERRYNISFENFEPAIIYTGGYTGITERTVEELFVPQEYSSYGSGSSYISSYFSSYGSGAGLGLGLGTGVGSGSFNLFSSYVTSGSSNTSFAASYRTSYTFSGSSMLTFFAPYTAVCGDDRVCASDICTREVFYAAGYGLDLI